MVKYTFRIRQRKPANFLSLFDQFTWLLIKYIFLTTTAWKGSVFGVILDHIFPYSYDVFFLDFQVKAFERFKDSRFLRISSKCGKMRTRITPNTNIFYTVHDYSLLSDLF